MRPFEFHQDDSKSSGDRPNLGGRIGRGCVLGPRTRNPQERRIGPFRCGMGMAVLPFRLSQAPAAADRRWMIRGGAGDCGQRMILGARPGTGGERGHTLPRFHQGPRRASHEALALPGFRWGGRGRMRFRRLCERSGGGWEAAGGMSGRD